MPQMAPINWLSLFFLFSLTFILFNIMNFFSLNLNKSLNKTLKMNKSFMNWKW
uniref:ATP synthase complex subunit 8 n=1 Tax=Sciara ruficauda TaxID=1260812 RepID=A0A6G7GC45_9DIPT|nr:ATP synthase F0 subunit 8 [Sciara ruficauda]QIH95754.1 ATP synthase F0 subunit 8 [Sciara ruficauda]